MPESFSFPITQTPEEAVEKARAEARKRSADFQGDAAGGTFNAMGVSGAFRIVGSTVEVDILERPFYAPMSIIESTIRSMFQ